MCVSLKVTYLSGPIAKLMFAISRGMVNDQNVSLLSPHARGWEGVDQRIQSWLDIWHAMVTTINNTILNYKEGKPQKSWVDVNYHKNYGSLQY